MLATAVLETIRAIFLHPQTCVTKPEAAALLGWTIPQLKIAIAAGVIETTTTCRGERIPLSEVATIARDRWQPALIEQALGNEAKAILPVALRTRRASLRLPVYLIATLAYLAEREGVTVDAVASRQLDRLLGEHADELAVSSRVSRTRCTGRSPRTQARSFDRHARMYARRGRLC